MKPDPEHRSFHQIPFPSTQRCTNDPPPSSCAREPFACKQGSLAFLRNQSDLFANVLYFPAVVCTAVNIFVKEEVGVGTLMGAGALVGVRLGVGLVMGMLLGLGLQLGLELWRELGMSLGVLDGGLRRALGWG